MEIVKEIREFEKKTTVTKEGITIFLENQDEINELYAITNFAPIGDALVSDFISSLYKALGDHKTSDYDVFHDKLHNGLTWGKR